MQQGDVRGFTVSVPWHLAAIKSDRESSPIPSHSCSTEKPCISPSPCLVWAGSKGSNSNSLVQEQRNPCEVPLSFSRYH